MSYQDHLRTCSYCSKNNPQKPTVRIKAASSYRREKKLSELGALIKGVSYSTISYPGDTRTKAKGASAVDGKAAKLRELGKIVRGPVPLQ